MSEDNRQARAQRIAAEKRAHSNSRTSASCTSEHEGGVCACVCVCVWSQCTQPSQLSSRRTPSIPWACTCLLYFRCSDSAAVVSKSTTVAAFLCVPGTHRTHTHVKRQHRSTPHSRQEEVILTSAITRDRRLYELALVVHIHTFCRTRCTCYNSYASLRFLSQMALLLTLLQAMP